MISRRAVQTVLFNAGLGVVILLAALLSGGDYVSKIIPFVVALVLAGVIAFIALIVRGSDSERECDERERLIIYKTGRTTVILMSFVLMGYWAYEVATIGTFVNPLTAIVFAFWGIYLAAYLFYKFRH